MHVKKLRFVLLVLTALVPAVEGAHADVVTDSNAKAAEIASRNPATPIAVRTMAIVQVSVFEAVNAITGRYPPQRTKISAAPGASVEAAVGDFVQEVAVARIYDGVHYRNSTEVGTAMGKKIGELAVKSFARPIR